MSCGGPDPQTQRIHREAPRFFRVCAAETQEQEATGSSNDMEGGREERQQDLHAIAHRSMRSTFVGCLHTTQGMAEDNPMYRKPCSPMRQRRTRCAQKHKVTGTVADALPNFRFYSAAQLLPSSSSTNAQPDPERAAPILITHRFQCIQHKKYETHLYDRNFKRSIPNR